MKKKLAFLLALTMMLGMASCGELDADSSSAAEAVQDNAPAAAAEEEDTASEETEEQSADSTEEEDSAESAEESASEAEESTAPFTESDADSAAADPLAQNVFSTPNGDFSYEQLHADGLANVTADGVYFALVSDGGGAGHAFYKVWSTESGEWAEVSQYQVASGNNTYIALDDGNIIRFYYQTAANEPYPQVALMSFADGEVSEITNANTFTDQVFDDGAAIYEHDDITFCAAYEGGYSFWLTFTGANGGVLDREFILDPETLDVVE